MELLFWVFLFGILIASVMDIKRREVDNWLTAFLFLFGVSFIIFSSIMNNDLGILVQGAIAVFVTFVLMNLFYYGRVFGGGDAKLLFALGVFFIGATYAVTLFNILVFVFLLFFSGAVYGLSYIIVIYFINFNKTNKEFRKRFNFKTYKFYFVAGAILLLLGIYFSLFYKIPSCNI